ncbi:MAG: cyclic 2,3-diphosphoglycerate synthase [Thermoplasmatales archaeon]|nr:cyclic 2,3-diphosphoglycerate synthase [Thermoplasmatales archaeon]
MKKVIIMGAAGRDFHNFNVFFRNNPEYIVAAFTATQIPDIEGRKYPKELAGENYPDGIPIYAENELPELIKRFDADQVVLAYSDLSYPYVMEKSAVVNAAGADFVLMGPKKTMLKSSRPVIGVCAVRTGCGKSQTARKIFKILKGKGLRVSSIRHPMPYDPDLTKQVCERFASYDDLDKYNCTIEEREEYEPYIDMGGVVYAGVDYEKILREAEKESDVIIWDGGNNDFPFIKPDLLATVVDPHRPGHEIGYYPGEVNLRMADIVVINKMDSAESENVKTVKKNIKNRNKNAKIIEANSPVTVDKPEIIKNKNVLVVEDGPTLTHGGMKYGAGFIAAQKFNANIIDPRKYAVGSIKKTYEKYSHLEKILPAMGYGKKQIKELETTINKAECDSVVIGTPIDLGKVLKISKPCVRVRYELVEKGKPDLEDVLKEFLKKMGT